MPYKEIYKHTVPGNVFLEDMEAQIYPLGTNYGGTLVGLIYVLLCPLKNLDTPMIATQLIHKLYIYIRFSSKVISC